MKQIKEIFGINVANFKEERIFIGTNTGIQWDNGHGKSFLIIQYLINLSTRLNYDIGSFSGLQTPETNFLATLSLGANDKEVKNDKDKKDNIVNRLEQLFNKNEQKHLMSFTGLYIIDEDKDEYFMVITYPSGSNVLNLERQFLKLKDKDSYSKIFTYLKKNVLHQNKQLIPILYNIKSDIISLEIIKDKKNECGEKLESSEYLKEKKGQDDFSLGYKSSMDLGNDLIIATSQKDNSVVEKGLINKTTEKILIDMKDDLQFLFNNNGIAHIFEDYLKIKEVKIDELKIISKDLEKYLQINLKEDFNIIKQYYDKFYIEYTNQKNNYNGKSDIFKTEINEFENKIMENESNFSINKKILEKIKNQTNTNVLYRDIEQNMIKLKEIEELYNENDFDNLVSIINNEIQKYKDIEKSIDEIKIKIKDLNNIEEIKEKELKYLKKNKLDSEEEIKILSNKEETLFDKTKTENLKAYLVSINKTNILEKNFSNEEIKEIENSINYLFSFDNLKIDNKYFLNLNEPKRTIEQIEEDIEYTNKLIYKIIIEIEEIKNNKILLEKDLTELNVDPRTIETKKTILRQNFNHLNSYNTIKMEQEKVANELIKEFNININSFSNDYLILDVLNYLDKKYDELLLTNIELSKSNEDIKIKINEIQEKIEILNKEFNYSYEILNTDIEEFIKINDDFIELDNEFELDVLNLIELDKELINLKNELYKKCSSINQLFSNLIRNDAINNHRELNNVIKSYNLNKVENLNLIDYINEFKYLIDNVISCNLAERENNLLPLSEKLIKFNHVLNEINIKIKSNLKNSLKEIFNIQSNSGHKYYLKNDNYLEDYKLENNFRNSLREIFHVDSPEEIHSDEIEGKLKNTHIDAINNLIKTLKQFNEEFILCNSSLEKMLELYIKDKTKEYEITSDSISTGNKIVLSTNLRNITLHSNKNFIHLLFLDEIGNVDKNNIQILNNANIDNKVILGNQGFDHLRNFLDVLNQSKKYNENERFIRNEPLWLKRD